MSAEALASYKQAGMDDLEDLRNVTNIEPERLLEPLVSHRGEVAKASANAVEVYKAEVATSFDEHALGLKSHQEAAASALDGYKAEGTNIFDEHAQLLK